MLCGFCGFFFVVREEVVVQRLPLKRGADRAVHAAFGEGLGALREGFRGGLDRLGVVGGGKARQLLDQAVDLGALVRGEEIGVFGLVSALFFLLILTFGLAYAWRKGALEWK